MRAVSRLCVVPLFFLATASAQAGGFAVAEQSASAGGTGGAGTARADDVSAAWYNPAALADGAGFRAGFGLLAALPKVHAEAIDESWTSASDSGVSTPPHLHLSYAAGHVAYGIAVGIPYGGGVSWPQDWAGRHEIIASQLMVSRMAPFVAVRRGRLRVALGGHVNWGRLQLQRTLDFVDTEGDVHLDLDGAGAGVEVALFYQLSSHVDVGASYKSRTTLKLLGGADFSAPDAFNMKTADQTVAIDFALPDRVAFGVSWHQGRVAVLADVEMTLWSVNQRMVIDFQHEETPDVQQTNDWQNTYALRCGVEYQLRRAWRLRAGGFVDETPVAAERLTPSSPDSSRVGLTLGTARRLGDGLTLDVFYEFMSLLGRQSENEESLPASYGGDAQMLGLGLRYQR